MPPSQGLDFDVLMSRTIPAITILKLGPQSTAQHHRRALIYTMLHIYQLNSLYPAFICTTHVIKGIIALSAVGVMRRSRNSQLILQLSFRLIPLKHFSCILALLLFPHIVMILITVVGKIELVQGLQRRIPL